MRNLLFSFTGKPAKTGFSPSSIFANFFIDPSRWTGVFFILSALLFFYVAASTIYLWFKTRIYATLFWYEYAAILIGSIALLLLLAHPQSPIHRFPQRVFITGLAAFFFVSRLVWVLIIPNEQVNDFLVLNNLANYLAPANPLPWMNEPNQWHIFMYPWAYSLILGWFYSILGSSLLVGKLLNVLLGTLTLFFLYHLGKTVMSEQAGRSAAILFFLWPTQLAMTLLIAAEHISLLAMLAALYFFYTAQSSRQQRIFRLLLCGIFLSLTSITRFPLLVVLIACLLTLLVIKGFRKQFFLEGALILVGFFFLNSLYTGILSSVYQVNLPSRSIAGNLLVGVNVEAGGAWNAEDVSTLISFPTMEEANEWAGQVALERIKSNPLRILRLMVYKSGVYWREDDYGVFWALQMGLPDELITPYLVNLLNVTRYYHYFILITACIGTVYLMRKKAHDPRLNLILLPLLGSTLLHSLLEVQNRYHYPFEPLLFLLAAAGAAAAWGASQKIPAALLSRSKLTSGPHEV